MTLAKILNLPHPQTDWNKQDVAKDELKSIILSLMDHNGPSHLTDREKEIIRSLR
jgi:hypothetical protein